MGVGIKTRRSVATYTGIPQFTYTGAYAVTGNQDNWQITFTTSGVFQLLKPSKIAIDVFVVGGGCSGGGAAYSGVGQGAGGAGGHTKTSKNIEINKILYPVVIGNGGAARLGGGPSVSYNNGGSTNAFGVSVPATNNTNGGSGGGGSDSETGTGQGTTTKEFGEPTGQLYSSGGGGGGYYNNTVSGGHPSSGGNGGQDGANGFDANTGGSGSAGGIGGIGAGNGGNHRSSGKDATFYGCGGGGGGQTKTSSGFSVFAGGSGYQGLVIIRNTRG